MKIVEEEEQLHRFIVSSTSSSGAGEYNCSASQEKKLDKDDLKRFESSELANWEEQATMEERSDAPLSAVWPPTSEQMVSPEGDQIVIHRPWPLKHCVKRRRWRRPFFLSEFGIFRILNVSDLWDSPICCRLVVDVCVCVVTLSPPP